ncbi:MAG: ABC transporter substrate-binding protein, partial [Candidatus Bathyarchaeia archaeon]
EERGYEPYRVDENFGLYPPGTTDFSSIILAWKEAECQILWANLPAPDFGVFWRQAHQLGWVPKMALAARAAMIYEDVVTWGGDLPLGIVDENFWSSAYPYPGIGNRTAQSLADEWYEEKGTPIGDRARGYGAAQLLFAAIEEAGTLDREAINDAFLKVDITTIYGHHKFIPETHDSPCAVTIVQWFKTENPWVWERRVVYSNVPEITATNDPIFPLPGCTFP